MHLQQITLPHSLSTLHQEWKSTLIKHIAAGQISVAIPCLTPSSSKVTSTSSSRDECLLFLCFLCLQLKQTALFKQKQMQSTYIEHHTAYSWHNSKHKLQIYLDISSITLIAALKWGKTVLCTCTYAIVIRKNCHLDTSWKEAMISAHYKCKSSQNWVQLWLQHNSMYMWLWPMDS